MPEQKQLVCQMTRQNLAVMRFCDGRRTIDGDIAVEACVRAGSGVAEVRSSTLVMPFPPWRGICKVLETDACAQLFDAAQ